jgi:hypothetical protein
MQRHKTPLLFHLYLHENAYKIYVFYFFCGGVMVGATLAVAHHIVAFYFHLGRGKPCPYILPCNSMGGGFNDFV